MAQPVPPRDMRIIEDCLAVSEPVFVFRAKDVHSIGVLEYYLQECIDADCDNEFADAVNNRIEHFRRWRDENPDKVAAPDLREGEY